MKVFILYIKLHEKLEVRLNYQNFSGSRKDFNDEKMRTKYSLDLRKTPANIPRYLLNAIIA